MPPVILSSDSHVFEPPISWQTSIDAPFRDRAVAGVGAHLHRTLPSITVRYTPTSAGLLPLFSGAASAAQVRAMADVAPLDRAGALRRALHRPRRQALRATALPARPYLGGGELDDEGFARSGEPAFAAELRDATEQMIAQGGFSEYFDPRDGAGIGGVEFSWTAAVYLMLRVVDVSGGIRNEAPFRSNSDLCHGRIGAEVRWRRSSEHRRVPVGSRFRRFSNPGNRAWMQPYGASDYAAASI